MAAARYEIIRQLACGGMAEVLLARRTGDDGASDLVVIKRVLPHLSQAEGFMRMFATEARIASQLQHHNIVAVVEVGEMDALPFIAMERLDGGDLLRLLQQCVLRRQQLGTAVAMAVVAGAARGLGYAHRARARDGRPLKIIHRDVSPHNIFVTRDGGVKLLDFGIAKSAAQVGNTSTGQVKGKISYMSPEQIRARPLDARSDLWSLGVVLWESIAGEKLFTRDNDAATLHAILHDPIPRLKRADSPEVDDVIAQILTREPERRIGTAEEIAQRLEQLLAHSGQSSLTRLIAQRVASLVPSLNPELDAVKPAVARSPEVVTFALGPAFSQHAAQQSPSADHRGPHRKLDIAAMPIDEHLSSRDDEDPTLLEIAAPPPDPDFDGDDTFDKNDARPVVGETTDTHTIPMQRAVQATGTNGPVLPETPAPIARRAVPEPPVSARPVSVPNRHPTRLMTGPSQAAANDPGAASKGPSPRIRVRDEFDDSLTSEIMHPPTGDMPAAPMARQAPRGAPERAMPDPPKSSSAPPRHPSSKPLPPTIASGPRPPPSNGEKRPSSATATQPGVGPGEKPGTPPLTVVTADGSRPKTMPPRPPPHLEHAHPPEVPARARHPHPHGESARSESSPSDSGITFTFGDVPPKPAPPVFPLAYEPTPTTRVGVPTLAPPSRLNDTLAAAEIPSTVQRRTLPPDARRNPLVAVATVGGLCLVAGMVVFGAYLLGGIRANTASNAAQGTSTAALRPAASPAITVAPPTQAPAAAEPAPPSVPAPAAIPAPPSVPVAAPIVAAPEPAPPSMPEVAPEPAPAPPVRRAAPPAAPVVHVARAVHAVPVAPRVLPVAPRAPSVVPRASARPAGPVRLPPSRGPLPDPFATVSHPTVPTRITPEPAHEAPPPVHRPPPTVRGGGIFTDL